MRGGGYVDVLKAGLRVEQAQPCLVAERKQPGSGRGLRCHITGDDWLNARIVGALRHGVDRNGSVSPRTRTRQNSARPRAGSGKNISPRLHSTASKLASAKLSAWPSSIRTATFARRPVVPAHAPPFAEKCRSRSRAQSGRRLRGRLRPLVRSRSRHREPGDPIGRGPRPQERDEVCVEMCIAPFVAGRVGGIVDQLGHVLSFPVESRLWSTSGGGKRRFAAGQHQGASKAATILDTARAGCAPSRSSGSGRLRPPAPLGETTEKGLYVSYAPGQDLRWPQTVGGQSPDPITHMV